jgi:branched-chain amino acid transport system ATP-binding protein
MLLDVTDVCVAYDSIQALWDVSLSVQDKSVTALVGSNGSGKSTLMNTIIGVLFPYKGKITAWGNDITHAQSNERVEMGLALVPEGRRLFPNSTVEENLKGGAFVKRAREKMNETMDWVNSLFPLLKERRNQKAGTLSGGEQQMLAIARSLMSQPKLLMLDEPSFGLAPKLVTEVFEMIQKIRDEGLSILIVEQNVQAMLGMADRAYVIENGKVVMEGTGENLMGHDRIKKAYLGM